MTKKDKAIEWFTMLREKFTGTEYGEYLDIAIEVLEQQPCEDCISREAAFDEIIWNSDNGVIDAKGAIEALRKLPSVEPERNKGKWIRGKYWNVGIGMGEQYGYFYKCSECGKEVKGGYTECTDRFCKSCGAKMEVDG